ERYGVKRVCAAWELARSTWYARQPAQRRERPLAGKRGPKTKLSDAQLLDSIRTVLRDSPFVGEGHRKVWAKLRHVGTRSGKPRGGTGADQAGCARALRERAREGRSRP